MKGKSHLVGMLRAAAFTAVVVHAEMHGTDHDPDASKRIGGRGGLQDVGDGSILNLAHVDTWDLTQDSEIDALLDEGSMDGIFLDSRSEEEEHENDGSSILPLSDHGYDALKRQSENERATRKTRKIGRKLRQTRDGRVGKSSKARKSGKYRKAGKVCKSYNSKGSKGGKVGKTCLDRSASDHFTFYTIVHDYQMPHMAPSETIASSDMYLALLQDDTEVNPNTIQEIEKLTLGYLAENIGGELFEPVCVEVIDNAYDKQVVPESNKMKPAEKPIRKLAQEFVESTVLQLEVSYILKGQQPRSDGEESALDAERSKTNETMESDQEGQALKTSQCTPLKLAECCGQIAVNSNPGKFCQSVGCDFSRCSPCRPPL